jgi:hypothetical protein
MSSLYNKLLRVLSGVTKYPVMASSSAAEEGMPHPVRADSVQMLVNQQEEEKQVPSDYDNAK